LELKLSSPLKFVAALPCEMANGHQYSFKFILARMVRFMSGGISITMPPLFVYLSFLPDTDVIMTIVQYFVCCITHSFNL